MSTTQGYTRITAIAALGAALLLWPGCDRSGDADPEPDMKPSGAQMAVVPDLAASEPVPTQSADEPQAQDAAPVGPQITFEKTLHDFGEIWDVHKQTCRFQFTNTGDEELIISNIKATCGCTATSLEKRKYAPGEGAALEIVFTPKGRGQQNKHINITSNTESDPLTRLTITADITPFVTVEPTYMRFDGVELGSEHKASITITCRDPLMTIESVVVAGDYFSASVVDNPQLAGETSDGETPSRHVVEVTLHSDAPWGERFASVSVICRGRLDDTSEPIEHTVRMNVRASLYGEIKADAVFFLVSTVPQGGSFEKSVRLTHVAGEPFEILGVDVQRSSMPGVTVRAEPIREEGVAGYDIILSGDAGDYLGGVNGVVVITTDVRGEELLELRFAGVVRVNKRR